MPSEGFFFEKKKPTTPPFRAHFITLICIFVSRNYRLINDNWDVGKIHAFFSSSKRGDLASLNISFLGINDKLMHSHCLSINCTCACLVYSKILLILYFSFFLVSENVEAPFHTRRRYPENPYFLGRNRTRRSKCIENQGYIWPGQNRSKSELGQRIYLSNGTDRAGLAKWRRSITEGFNCQGIFSIVQI